MYGVAPGSARSWRTCCALSSSVSFRKALISPSTCSIYLQQAEDPYAGVNLYSFLKSLSIKTTAYNMGMVASAGVPFFLGFDTRIGVPNCSFMVHQTTINRNSFPENVNVFEMQTQLQLLAGTDKKTQSIIEKETSAKTQTPLTATEVETAIERSQTYQANDALKYGFIERIEQPEISKINILYVTDDWLKAN